MKEIVDVLNFYKEIGASFVEFDRRNAKSGLNEINREIFNCRKCNLHKTKTNYVPGEGSSNPDILFIGEGPGETEDKFGRPFIGKAGQILDRIIEKMGYTRETVFIGNIVKCRPPGNRDPLKDEVHACLPYLKDQIMVLKPKVLVCLGKVAFNNLMGTSSPITSVRGKIFSFNDVPVVPTFHPSYILHKRAKEEKSRAKWDIWNDMQKVLELVKSS